MKKFDIKPIIAAMAFAALLTGCGSTDSDESSDSSAAETTTSAPETTEAPETNEASETEAVTAEAAEDSVSTPNSAGAEVSDIRQCTCFVLTNGVDFCLDGDVVKHIDSDTAEMLAYADENGIDPADLIHIEDYDFDGNYDVFVPDTFGVPNLGGKYYRFDKDNVLVSWDELNAIGYFMNIDYDNETLSLTISSSLAEWEMNEYGWNNGSLYVAIRQVQYENADGDIIREDYEGDTLVSRKKLIIGDTVKDVIGTEDLPLD